MPSTDAPNWWADVQQEREDLAPAGRGRRPAEDWLGEEIDFVPRRRMARGDVDARTSNVDARTSNVDARASHADARPRQADTRVNSTGGAPSVRRTALSPAAARAAALREASAADDATAEHPLHGVFVPAAPHAPLRESASSMTIELTTGAPAVVTPASPADVAHELAHLSAADDPFASPPPPVGARRTVQIKGRPEAVRLPSMAQRHRPRTASDRVGARPDRIALWAVALGAILIILAATTSSSQAAVPHRAATPAVAAKHVTVKHTAPLRSTPLRATYRHR
jgi:hypothetical protein